MEKDNTYRKLEKDFAAIRDERGTQANTANRIGSAFLSLLSYIGSAAFLRKDVQDTAEQVMTFLKGIVAKAVSYFQGIVNKGDINNHGDITNTGNIHNTGDITNTGTIMTNNLTVTGKATFFELEIQKAKAAGGMSVNSAGTFHVDAVEETEYEFVCYQRADKDGVVLLQTCEPKDQMMCSNGMNSLPLPLQGSGEPTNGGEPHAIGNHYYWRLATDAPKELVTHTIDGKEEKCLKLVLSKTDRQRREDESPQDIGDMPKVGDDLVQIGNRDNKERQSVIMTCAYNSFDGDLKAPYWVQYTGVNDYKLSTHKRTWFAANGSQVTGNFKVQSDNGGLKSIEDYMKGLTTNTYKLVMSGSQFNVKADGSLSPQFISIYAYKVQGENLTQLSPSEKVKVFVTKGENKVPLDDKKESLAVRSDKWNLWPDKENMADVFNVNLFINDKLVDMQKIHVVMDGRNGDNGKDAEVWHIAFSIRNITGKQGETFKLRYGRTVGKSTSWYDDNPIYHGFNQLYAVIIDGATGKEKMVSWEMDLNVADFFTGGSMTVRLMNSKTGELLAQDTIFPEAKSGKDAVSYKLIPLSENVLAYFTKEDEKNTENTGKKKEKKKKIDIRLLYKIMKSAGEQVTFTTLKAEGMTLTLQPSVDNSETFTYNSGAYGFGKIGITYNEIPDNSYKVTLKKGSDIVDQRIVPITFKPKVVFDIDTENGEIRSEIKDVDDNVNSFKATIKETSNTVGNLKKEFTQMKLTSKEISFTVNNGTRPNLLWGSDLDLSEVQDKIQLAYELGAAIKQETAEKEDLQRQLDATSTNDTAKRDDLQEKINVCNDNITTVKKNVNECKAAIEKHFGVGLASTKIDSEEWFEYQKGRGVGGGDAIKFKTLAGVSEYPGLFWEKQCGGKYNIKLKPHTTYTLSAWVKVEFDKKADGYVGFGFEAFKNEDSMSGRKPNNASRLNFSENPAFSNPTDGWIRFVRTFTTDDLDYGSVTMNIYGTKPATLYLCRPKLEEGNKETPWCAYDGTVEALLASGFSLKDKEFTATSDNFKVQNNKGEQTFLVDKNGHINAKLISAESITAQKIAQPFVEQEKFEYLMAGPSQSWYITNAKDINGGYVLASELNGSVLNIYNHTAETIKFYSTFAIDKAKCPNPMVNVRVKIEPGGMLRAIGVPIKGVEMNTSEGTTTLVALAPLVPIELTSLEGDLRARYVGVVKGFLTIK